VEPPAQSITAALGRRSRLLLAALVVVVSLVLPGSASAALSIGIHGEREGADFLSEAEVLRMRQGGARELRITFDWEVAQKDAAGPVDLDKFDKLMKWASQGDLPRLRVLPILIGSPNFVERSDASGQPPVTDADLELWRQFVDRLVSRFGPAGSFWTDTSGVQFNPITDWQVWNEPNLRMFWTDADPDAEEYAAFLDFTGKAIRSVHPGARIVLAGMPQREDAPKAMADFLEQLYEVKGFKRDFDVVAVHPFVPLKEKGGLEEAVLAIREILIDNGDARKIMYLTELGAASAGPATPFTTTERGQRKALKRLFAEVGKIAKKNKIRKAYWHKWRDSDKVPPDKPENNRWQTYTGLFRKDGSPKSAWSAFAALTGGDPGSGSLP
jgi:hypothetical protein